MPTAHPSDPEGLLNCPRTSGVAAVVSADGVPLALSEHSPAGFGPQLAAITSGLTSLMQGAARLFEAGLPTQALVEMEGGLMFVMAISDGSSLAVLAAPECDTDLVAYEMSLLVEAVGDILTPATRASQGLLPAAASGPAVSRRAAGRRSGLRPA